MPDYSDHTVTSRTEEILKNMVDGTEITVDPQSVVEYLLIQLNDKIGPGGGALRPAGSKTFSQLGAPSEDQLGCIYNITDAFTTNEYFIDGAGTNCPAGTNVYGIVTKDPLTEEDVYYWDVFGAAVDLSDYVDKDMINAANGVAGLDENGQLDFSDVGVDIITKEDLEEMWGLTPESSGNFFLKATSDQKTLEYEVEKTGTYLVVAGYPYQGSASITFSNAEIISSKEKIFPYSVSVDKGLICKIANVEVGETITINVDYNPSWPAIILAIIELTDIEIDTTVDITPVGTSDGSCTYTLPNDDDNYLVFGAALGKGAASNHKDNTTYVHKGINEGNKFTYTILGGTLGLYNDTSLLVCKGNESPNFSFYGYDGGWSAIFAWKLI